MDVQDGELPLQEDSVEPSEKSLSFTLEFLWYYFVLDSDSATVLETDILPIWRLPNGRAAIIRY